MDDIGYLRTIAESELELMRSWRNAPTVRQNMYSRHEISMEEHRAWWGRISNSESARYFMYEITGIPSGIVAFMSIDMNSRNALWAFYASPGAPKGVGAKMEFLALEYAFNDLALHKLSCEVLEFNKQVINLHKKFGFSIEGVFREHHFVETRYVDVCRLGILSCEWQLRREEMQSRIGLAVK